LLRRFNYKLPARYDDGTGYLDRDLQKSGGRNGLHHQLQRLLR
jgi:hypothetical protein